MLKNIDCCLKDKSCCGCGACVNICPTKAICYSNDEYGFIIPKIDETLCVSCGKCLEICPARKDNSSATLETYAATNKQDNILVKSSSGGIFFAIAQKVIREGGVVFGCTMDNQFQVKHIRIDSLEALPMILKSKYVQSFLGQIYCEIKHILTIENKVVLFCGTPCQVSALKNFIGVKNSEKLLTVDLVCHGVPSQQFFDDYRNFLEVSTGKKIEEYIFRYKSKKDKSMNWYIAYKKSGQKITIKNWPEDSYNYLYMQSLIYRDSCYQCRYTKQERTGDFTLCDYWGWEKLHSEFSYKDSVSAVLINTEKAKKIFESISNDFIFCKTSLQNVIAHNSCLKEHTQKIEERNQVLRTWKLKGYDFIDKTFKKKHHKQILKYSIMRHIPKKILYKLTRK